MKYLVILLFSGMILLTRCNDSTNNLKDVKLSPKQEAELLNNRLKIYEVPSQRFNIPSDKPSSTKGRKGTTIYVNPADLEDQNGKSVNGTIALELKELTNKNDLLRANTRTNSNGKLLVSGGAYYINMTSEDKQLRLKQGKNIKVVLPKISNETMELFYGQRDSLGNMNWQTKGDVFTSANETKSKSIKRSAKGNNDTSIFAPNFPKAIDSYVEDTTKLTEMEKKELKELEKFDTEVYNIISINELGWINCDKFLDENNLINIGYAIDPKDSITFAQFYLVYKSINSVSGEFYYSNEKTNTRYFNNTPMGYEVRLIALAFKNNEILTYKLDLTTTNNLQLPIVLKKTTTDELNKLFDVK